MKVCKVWYYFLVLVCTITTLLRGDLYSKDRYKNGINIATDYKLEKVNFNQLAGWDMENFTMALELFLMSCRRFSKFDEDRKILPQISKDIIRKDLDGICRIAEAIRNYENKYVKIFFEKFFIPYRVVSDKSLFTGYYIPIIMTKRKRDAVFKYPVYRRPTDLTNNRYYTRKEINLGVLNNKGLEIFYTNDLIELFFLHIQGSGIAIVVDENNKVVYIGYDGKNNHKYSSSWYYTNAKGLIDKNHKSDAKTIKDALKNSKNNAINILNMNDSYIFFKVLKDNTIRGSFGTELISQRTIAVDKNYIPLGFLLWLDTKHILKNRRFDFRRIVLANDTGAAIKGVIRGDIFFGYGSDGENNASYQYSEGKYYLLIPKKIARKL